MSELLVTASAGNPRQGQYAVEIDGTVHRYPRVTTILGIVSRPGIEAWRLRVGTDEATRISTEAANHGTALHKILEDIDLGRKTVVPDTLQPWVVAYHDWKAANVVEVVAVERTVHHATHCYAGTLDRVYRLHSGAVVVGDLKSGKTVDGIYKLQLCAYVEALRAMGETVDDERVVLHLPSDRPGHLTPITFDDPRDFKAWRACLRLWRWHSRNKDFWKGTAK